MAYHRDGDLIILVMKESRFERLMLALCAAAGLAANWRSEEEAQAFLNLAHDLNEGNPECHVRLKA